MRMLGVRERELQKRPEDADEVKIFPSPEYVAILRAFGEGQEYGAPRRIW